MSKIAFLILNKLFDLILFVQSAMWRTEFLNYLQKSWIGFIVEFRYHNLKRLKFLLTVAIDSQTFGSVNPFTPWQVFTRGLRIRYQNSQKMYIIGLNIALKINRFFFCYVIKWFRILKYGEKNSKNFCINIKYIGFG